MNFMAIIQFFKAIYTSIFKRFFAIRSIKSGLFRSVSTYYSIIKIDSKKILY